MGKNICFVCKKTFPDADVVRNDRGEQITELCSSCNLIRFFTNDDKEVKYRKYYVTLETFIKKHADKFYDETIHGRQVAQLARCEVQVEHYERMIGNNRETNSDVHKLLQNERVHLRAMYNILQASVQSLRGDKKVHEHDLPKDFKALLAQGLLKAVEADGKTG